MSPPVPKTAMVFAAGLGTRMRPITETLPKPLVKVGGRALIDHCLDRLAENGVERAIVNVHWLADQIEAHLAKRRSPKIVISDERAKLLDQGGGIKRALPMIGDDPFLVCNTDAFWIEGPRSNIARLAAAFDPEAMDILLLVAASAGAVGVDWPGDFTMAHDGRLEAREPRHVAPFVYTGVGIVKPRAVREPVGGGLSPRAVLSRRRGKGPALRRSPRRPLGACRPAGDHRRGGTGDRPVDPVRCFALRRRRGAISARELSNLNRLRRQLVPSGREAPQAREGPRRAARDGPVSASRPRGRPRSRDSGRVRAQSSPRDRPPRG